MRINSVRDILKMTEIVREGPVSYEELSKITGLSRYQVDSRARVACELGAVDLVGKGGTRVKLIRPLTKEDIEKLAPKKREWRPRTDESEMELLEV